MLPYLAKAAPPGSTLVIPVSLEPVFSDVLTLPTDVLPDGLTAAKPSISIGRQEVWARYILDGRPVSVLLTRRIGDCQPGISSRDFCVIADGGHEAGPCLATTIAARLDAVQAAFWVSVVPAAIQPVHSSSEHQGRIIPWFQVAGLFWLVLATILVVVFVRRLLNDGFDAWFIDLILVASSLVVRLLAATWGPGDIFMNLSNVFYGQENLRYGAGADPILVPLVRLLAGDDRTVIAFNLAVGSLCPSLFLAFLRRIDFSEERTRVAAAVMLAFLPLPVRFAGECNRQALVLFLGLAALWGLGGIRRDARFTGFATAVAGASLAFMTRPEGSLILILLGLLAAALAWKRGTWWPILAFATAAAIFIVYYLDFHAGNSTSQTYVSRTPVAIRLAFLASPTAQTWLDPRFTPMIVIMTMAIGIRDSFREDCSVGTWAVFSLIGLGFMYVVMPGSPGGAIQLAHARYQTLSAIPMILLAARGSTGLLGLPFCHLAPRIRVGRCLLGATALLSLVVSSKAVLGPTDVDFEYLALREWVADLPRNSEIHQVYGTGKFRHVEDLSLRSPDYLSRILHRPDVTWLEWPYESGNPENPRFFLLPAACTEARVDVDSAMRFAEFLDACKSGLAAANPTPFRLARFPFRRFMDARTGNGSITVGLYPLSLTDRSGKPD